MSRMPKRPFEQAVNDMVKTFDISTDEALRRVQERYDSFKARNERLLERQNDQANKAQINLTTHCTLLATGVLAVGGAFIGTVYEKTDFTHIHVAIFVVVVLSELVSLTLSLVDYVLTGRFHAGWAKAYQDIDKDTEASLNNGNLQLTSQLGEIEAKHIEKQTIKTSPYLQIAIIATVLLGVWAFFLLILTYFIDVPYYKN